jgi:hypothetical protein
MEGSEHQKQLGLIHEWMLHRRVPNASFVW